MGRWLKRIAIGVAAFGLCLFLAVWFGGRWSVQHYLAKESKAGPGAFRFYSPRFRWSLDLDADSAVYESPTVDVRAKGIRLSADLFGSLFHFQPWARVRLDSVFIRVRPGPDTIARSKSDTAKAHRDSIPFPVFKIPGNAYFRIKRLVVRDTASDSLAPLADVEGLKARTRGGYYVSLQIASIKARATGGLVHRLRASADWAGRDSLAASIAWGRGQDSASLEARLSKADLLRLNGTLRARVASTRPYAQALGLPATLPRGEAIALDAELGRSRELTARVKLGLRVAGLPRTLPLSLPDQAVSLRFDFGGRAGQWSLRASGGGTQTELQGGLAVAAGAKAGHPTDSLAFPAFLARHAQVTLRGRLRGFRAAVGGKTLPADLDVEDAHVSPEAVKASLVTGDGSRVEVDLRRTRVTVSPLPPWEGAFSLDAAPHEAWMLAFTDTNVVFAQARIAGDVRQGAVDATLEARGVRAYGVLADSLRAVFRYARNDIVLGPARLWRRGAAWDLSGRAETGKAGPPATVRLANPEFGSLQASQPGPGKVEVHARNLAPDHLPYRGLDSLAAYGPRLTTDFVWDRKARAGSLALAAEGRYRKDAVAASLRAAWDAERMDLREANASLGGNALSASGRVRLHGRQFYELKGVGPADVEEASLRAERFDLAKALAAFLPTPPLRSGQLDGALGFASGKGFHGTWRATGLALAGEERSFAIKEASVTGRGDTLIIRGVSVSDAEPLFRDSLAVALSGVLGKEQSIRVRDRAGQDITLAFDGGLTDFRDLKGRLSLRGGATLPGGSGNLSNVRLQADVILPLKDGLKGLQLTADTLLATYAVPGLDTQVISASVRMRAGKVDVPHLTLTGRDGAQLQGGLEFDPNGRRLGADLSGSRLSAQFGGDKVQLRELAAHLQMDSTQMIAQIAVGSGSFEHAKSALRAAGDVSRLTAYYRAPLGSKAKQTGGAIPLLRLSATLDSSDVRYRIHTTMEGLLNIFRKQGQRRTVARRAKPMQVDINVETSGRGNTIVTDVLRVSYVGNLSMVGTYPYALMRGRVTSISGGIGTKSQAYDIKNMEIKWLNAPLEEGELNLNAEKRLARVCDTVTTDSCAIRLNLTGPLSEIKFAYDSDCRGGFGSGGADVGAMLFSIQRGCYSPSASTSAGGLTYQEQALGLLDIYSSGKLSEGLGWLSGNWIQSAQVSGMASLAHSRSSTPTDTSSANLGVELLSKEFWRLRFRAKSAYNLQNADQFNPWSYRVGVEWRAPAFRLVQDPVWRARLKNHITVDASVFTDPSHSVQADNQDNLRQRLGLNYDYNWWGFWWAKRRPPIVAKPSDAGPAPRPASDTSAARKASAVPDAAR
ncbi:MAG: translocation/assembly module TamB domain-containing protein [Fibrobacteres bacterium]|nr:translocation/assembly module TamB domain-containing protein [Fibrobacterota bacterium]